MVTDRDGMNFVVLFTGDQESVSYSPKGVLRDADGGQRVVSLEEEKLAVVTFLETVMVIIFAHIFRFAKGDRNRKVRKIFDGNTEDYWGDVFQSLRDTRASATLHPKEMARFEDDEVFMDYANEPGSLLGMNGLTDMGASGIMGETYTLGGETLIFVNHLVRQLQSAHRLGRFANLISALYPLSYRIFCFQRIDWVRARQQ